jgi:hypothetical protein
VRSLTRSINATDSIVFQTGPSNGGARGGWTVQATVARELTVTGIRYELKGGTYQLETNASGTVSFGHFRAARPQP